MRRDRQIESGMQLILWSFFRNPIRTGLREGIENIHKVIDPLFLDELKLELDEILHEAVVKTKHKKLKEYQDKLATIVCLDAAAGSGNFLTESYLSLRRLENRVLGELSHGQMAMAVESMNPIKVSIGQFYGIEINDFAVVGGGSLVLQFTRVGSYAMIQGGTRFGKDVPPFAMIGREPAAFEGLNLVGLKRRGFDTKQIAEAQEIYRYFYQKPLNTTQAIEAVEAEIPQSELRDTILNFIITKLFYIFILVLSTLLLIFKIFNILINKQK